MNTRSECRGGCGRRSKSRDRDGVYTCHPCRKIIRAGLDPDHDLALTGGRWVGHKGFQIWVAA